MSLQRLGSFLRRGCIASVSVILLIHAKTTLAFNVEFVRDNVNLVSLPQAVSILNNPGNRDRVIWDLPFINLTGGGSLANFGEDTQFPFSDDVAVRVTGSFNINEAGTYTLGVNSDDGVSLEVDNSFLIYDDILRGPTNSYATTFLTSGTHQFELVFFERGGGASLELFIGKGSLSSFNNRPFQLLTENPEFKQGSWGSVLDWPLVAVSMANLPDGRILTYSGSERRTWPSTERTFSATWNPATGQFSERLFNGHNMFCGTTSMTKDGNVFVAGGRNQTNSPWVSQYNYQTDNWSSLPNMASGGRWYPTTLALGDGSILTAMGVASNVRNPDLWNEDTGWRVLNGIDFINMRTRRANANVFPLLSLAPDGDIYHFWDTVENHFISTAGNGSATVANDTTDENDHAGGVQVMYDEGKLLITGSNDGSWGNDSSTVTNNAFTVDLNGPNPVIQATQDMNFQRKFHQLLNLPTGEVLVVGGNTSGAKFQDNGSVLRSEIWNPDTGIWRPTASMTIPRDYHSTALLMLDGRVITAGGGYHPSNPNQGGTHQDAQLYSPPYLFDSSGNLASRPTISADVSEVGYGQAFGISTSGDIDYFSLIKMSSTTHAINTDSRFFKPAFNQTANDRYTITMHSNPNVASPGYWMLFGVDSNGVPSVAEVILVSEDVEVIETEPPVIDDIVTSPVSSAQSSVFSASASGSSLTYIWNFGDGTGDTISSSQNTISHTFAQPGKYVVSVIVTNSAGLSSVETFTQIVFGNLTAQQPVSSSGIIEINSRSEVWNVNPDNNSVGIINTNSLTRQSVINVGTNPRSLAEAPDGSIWIVNKDDATISVVNPSNRSIVQTINLDKGSRPHGIVFNNHSAYIALEGLGTVLQLNANTRSERRRIFAGEFPRHVTLDSTGSKLYLSNFITPKLPGEEGANPQVAGQGGTIRVYNTTATSLSATSTIVLGHSNRGIAEFQGPGLPNYLGPFTISPDGTSGWIPSKQDNILAGALRGGPGLTFDQTVRAVTSRVNLPAGTEQLTNRVDHDNASVASHAAFDPYGLTLFVSLEGNRQIALVDTSTNLEFARFDTNRAPQALIVSNDGTRLYVHNFMDRSVGIYDVSSIVNNGNVSANLLAEVDVVSGELLASNVFRGKQLFYDARDDRLAALDYMSCASCHNEGGHDGRTWDFTGLGEGVRNTIALNGTGGTDHGLIHWSGNFDEIQDFEGQIRSFAGGTGLMSDAQFFSGTRSDPLGDPKAGISTDLDALAAYMESLTQVAPSPYRNNNGTLTNAAQSGKALFEQFDCASCHSGGTFTDSTSSLILHDIGTLDTASGNRLDGPLTGIDTPTLLGIWQTAPYLHDGSASTVIDAIAAHSSIQTSNAQRASLAEYVLQIDNRELVVNNDLTLTPGQSRSASLAQDEWDYYLLSGVDDFSTVNVRLTNLTADLDLYTRVNAQPTLETYTCRSWNGGNDNELCSSPATNSLIIGVHGYRAGTYTISIEGIGGGTTDGGTTAGGVTDLLPGDVVTGSLVQNEWAYFSLANIQDFNALEATLTNLSADLDLYIGNGAPPTTDTYVCRSWNGGSDDESCPVALDQSMIIGVHGYRSGDFTLTLNGDNGGGTTDGQTTDGGTTDGQTTDGGTTDGQTTDGGTGGTINPGQTDSTSVTQGDWVYYQVNNPAGIPNVVATLSALTADIDLYVRTGSQPSLTEFDCRSWVAGTAEESCGVNLTGGTTWIGVHGYQAGSFTLTLSSGASVQSIGANANESASVDTSSWNYYEVAGSANLATIVADLGAMTADGDLYMKSGSLPSLTDFDCRSFVSGSNNESCSISGNGETVFIGVYGYQATPYTLEVNTAAAAARKAQAKPPAKDEITADLQSKGLIPVAVSVGGGGSLYWLLLLVGLGVITKRRPSSN